VRHRVGTAFSQLSTRYVDQFSQEYFGDQGYCIGVYIPPEVQAVRHLLDEWNEVWAKVVECYNRTYEVFRAQGMKKKDARSLARHIIPGGACTSILFTVNARELNHIFKLRGALDADPEFRRLTIKLCQLVRGHNVFRHWAIAYDEQKGEYLVVT
jgi:thymidylate synthase (FAD)